MEKKIPTKQKQQKTNSGPHFPEQSIGDNTKQCNTPSFSICLFKWLTWRKKLSDGDFLPDCNCEDQSKPE